MADTRHDAIDHDAAIYRSVLPGQRLAQLYAFWLLIEFMIRPPMAAFQLAVWLGQAGLAAAAGDPAPPLPDLSGLLAYVRDWTTLPLLAAAVAFFAYQSRFRFSPWALFAGTAVVLGNLWHAYLIVGHPDGFAGRLASINPDPALTDAYARVGWIIFGIWALAHLQFLYVGYRGQRALLGLPEATRRRLAEYAPGRAGWRAVARRLLHLPDALRYAKAKLVAAALAIVAGVSNVVNYWMTVTLLAMLVLSYGVYVALTRGDAPQSPAVVAIALALINIFVFVTAFCVRLFAIWAQRGSQSFMRRTLEEAQHLDPRPPILFLRSFLDDQVDLPPRDWRPEQWLFDASSRRATLDQILLEEGTVYGPSVALGDPSDAAPPYGVARGYFEHSDWQAAVAGLCDDAQVIVMVLDDTQGVAWEIGHLRKRGHHEKTLFLISPSDVGEDAGRRLLAKAAPDETPPPAAFGFAFDETGAAAFLTTERPDAYLYRLAVRRFLRDRLSAPGDDLSRSAAA